MAVEHTQVYVSVLLKRSRRAPWSHPPCEKKRSDLEESGTTFSPDTKSSSTSIMAGFLDSKTVRDKCLLSLSCVLCNIECGQTNRTRTDGSVSVWWPSMSFLPVPLSLGRNTLAMGWWQLNGGGGPTGWGQGDNEEFASCRDDVGSSQLGEARLGSLVAEGRLPPVGSGTEGGVEPRQRHCPLHRAI